MKEYICTNGNVVRFHDGDLVRDGKFTDAGMPVAREAMERFYRAILMENGGFFERKKVRQ